MLPLQSENINELSSALSKAQKDMSFAVKDSVNPFYKSRYADLGSVWDACRETLTLNGLAITQSLMPENDKIYLVTTLCHGSGQWMRSYMPLITSKQDAQGYGAAITYMRRYTLSALIGIVTDEDDDGNEASGVKIKKEKKISMEEKENKLEEIEKFFFTFGADKERIREYFTHLGKSSRKSLMEIISNFNNNSSAGMAAFEEWKKKKAA
jgi:hypothetical protein